MEMQALGEQKDIGEATHDTEQKPATHTLSPRWVFWVFRSERGKGWAECVRQQVVIETMEDLLALLTVIKNPNSLGQGTDYCFFKEGVMPTLDDEANAKGGALMMELPRLHLGLKLDKLFVETLYTVVGNQLGNCCATIVNGVTANRRRVNIWVANCERERVTELGKHLDEKITSDNLVRYKFVKHERPGGED